MPTTYLSPGVYVEEVPSAMKPIAGVSTSTAAFLGIVPDQVLMLDENPSFDPNQDSKNIDLTTILAPVDPAHPEKGTKLDPSRIPASPGNSKYVPWVFPAKPDLKGLTDTVKTAAAAVKSRKPDAAAADALSQMQALQDAQRALSRAQAHQAMGDMVAASTPTLCTSFSDFVSCFGSFSTDPNHNNLVQGVYGFFHNGGTRCWVMRFTDINGLRDPEALAPLEAIDEISLVAAPGIDDPVVQASIVDHCANMRYRFAILDCKKDMGISDPNAHQNFSVNNLMGPPNGPGITDHGALYFPWISVFDPATALTSGGEGLIDVGPSGHMAGIYARVDNDRGVFKAPANEVVRGAMDIGVQVSRSMQDGLNPSGINCIRNINDNITVWGARTIGGDVNADLKYINVRRTLIFIEKSIDEGTQWVVFEPNDQTLWAKIIRSVTAFLTVVWHDGALFGDTQQDAFYVKCDADTNPPENRDLGRVTTEIGVAIVRPAEFVIFRISQNMPQPQ
jgi:phage tail sheath protein FI